MKREPRAAKIKFKDHKTGDKKQPHLKLVGQKAKLPEKYKEFSQLDGTHPWQTQVPEGFIGYQARVVEQAGVTLAHRPQILSCHCIAHAIPHSSALQPHLRDAVITRL